MGTNLPGWGSLTIQLSTVTSIMKSSSVLRKGSVEFKTVLVSVRNGLTLAEKKNPLSFHLLLPQFQILMRPPSLQLEQNKNKNKTNTKTNKSYEKLNFVSRSHFGCIRFL